MFMHYVTVIFLAFMLAGCTRSHETPTPAHPSGNQTRQIAAFTHVHVNGPLDVTLHTGARNPQVILYGDSRDLVYVVWTVNEGVLHVDIGKGYPKYGPVRVDISSRYLSSFAYHGAGTVIGNNLQSNRLDLSIANKGKTVLQGHLALSNLDIKGSGSTQISGINSRSMQVKLSGKAHVQLVGVANVTALSMKGHGWISLYWVKSNALKIRAKDAVFIQMAGITELLDVELRGKARFNGRYLRSTRAFVKTYDHAEADISVVKRQHTLASDASNIYFYNLPTMKADFMAFNGAVLDMREWERAFLQEPTQYNQGIN